MGGGGECCPCLGGTGAQHLFVEPPFCLPCEAGMEQVGNPVWPIPAQGLMPLWGSLGRPGPPWSGCSFLSEPGKKALGVGQSFFRGLSHPTEALACAGWIQPLCFPGFPAAGNRTRVHGAVRSPMSPAWAGLGGQLRAHCAQNPKRFKAAETRDPRAAVARGRALHAPLGRWPEGT